MIQFVAISTVIWGILFIALAYSIYDEGVEEPFEIPLLISFIVLFVWGSTILFSHYFL